MKRNKLKFYYANNEIVCNSNCQKVKQIFSPKFQAVEY